MTRPTSVFATYAARAYPFRFEGALHVDTLVGGIPADPKVALAWIAHGLGVTTEDLLKKQVAEVMAERAVSPDEAIEQVNETRNLNGFKRERCPSCPPGRLCEGSHQLYIEGRQLKAAIKEAVSVAAAVNKLPLRGWGETKKFIHGFVAEHICVVEDRLYLGVTEPTGINQRFVATRFGTGIQYEEFVTGAEFDFTVLSDYEFDEEQWAMLWSTAEQQGIGATRSQGYGRFVVKDWKQVAVSDKRKKK